MKIYFGLVLMGSIGYISAMDNNNNNNDKDINEKRIKAMLSQGQELYFEHFSQPPIEAGQTQSEFTKRILAATFKDSEKVKKSGNVLPPKIYEGAFKEQLSAMNVLFANHLSKNETAGEQKATTLLEDMKIGEKTNNDGDPIDNNKK